MGDKRIFKPPSPILDPEISKRKVVFSKDHIHKKSWNKKGKDKESVEKKLGYYEQMTLSDFGKHKSADLKILKKKKSPPKSLSRYIAGECLWQFRINKKIRILGYLLDNTFYVVWVDWSHKGA